MQGDLFKGINFFWLGVKRLAEPGLRIYTLVPLLLNTLIMAALSWWGVKQLHSWTELLINWLPTWLEWLYWLILPLAVITLVFIVAYFFSSVLLVLLAPLCGLLSEKVDAKASITTPPESLSSLIFRTIKRELTKLLYLLPRYLLLFVLSFIPFINIISPFLWLLFMAWVAGVQYLDYGFDNQQHSFKATRQAARKDLLTVMGFGAAVVLFVSIPVLNWFVIPSAVIGATMLNQERKLRAIP